MLSGENFPENTEKIIISRNDPENVCCHQLHQASIPHTHTPMLHLRPLGAPKESLTLLFLPSPPPSALVPTAQLRSVQEEMHSLEEEKESELTEAQEELRAAQEEVMLLQQAAEDAAAERENDIASLQEELCRRRAELQRLSEETQEYELEITTLRAEISMKSKRREVERKEGEGSSRRRGVCGGGHGAAACLRILWHHVRKNNKTTVHKQKADLLSILCGWKKEKKKRNRDVPSRCALTSC